MITSAKRNGTACPYSYHEHLGKGPQCTRDPHPKCLSVQQPNLSTLHVYTLHIHVWGHEGNLVPEQARRVSDSSGICCHEVGSTPEEQLSTRSSWHLLEGPRLAYKQAPHILCIERGRLDSPHSPPDSPRFAAFPTAGGCRGDYWQPPFLMPGLPEEATHPIRYTWNETAQYLHFLLLSQYWSSIRLSFVMVMLYLVSYQSRSPAASMNLLFIFISSSALALQERLKMQPAQDRPQPKYTFSPQTQVNQNPSSLLILVTRQTSRSEGLLPWHATRALECGTSHHLSFKNSW